jgi:AAA+ ATPase superfamily predicted ATPase
MLHEFIGRRSDLMALRRELDRKRPSLLVVLGRRRVGKSRLLLEAIAGRPAIYYQATKIAGSMSLALFKTEAAKILGAGAVFGGLSDWHSTLSYIAQEAATRLPGLTVVFDEFPYLCDVDPSLPSVVQKFWDEARTKHGAFNLVLCGSKISFMEDLLAEKNPLHGRQNLKMDVGPLPYRDVARFFPNWSLEDRLRGCAIFGGIPFYLDLCDPAASLEDNVVDLVLAKGAALADEPEHLLQAELRDVTRYATILRAIADGCTKSGEIVGRVREFASGSALTPYLEKLKELRLVRAVRSLDATERERDRRYFLDDPFLAFWYRFCLPNVSALAAGHGEQIWKHSIAPKIDDYMGDLFEWVCRDHARLHLQEILPLPAQTIGQIWAGDFDIDVAGRLLDGTAIFGECKWWKDAVGENVLDRLIESAAATTYGKDAPAHHYILYSRSGFKPDLRRRAAADPSVHLVTLSSLLK